jgi:hypothetical protein
MLRAKYGERSTVIEEVVTGSFSEGKITIA